MKKLKNLEEVDVGSEGKRYEDIGRILKPGHRDDLMDHRPTRCYEVTKYLLISLSGYSNCGRPHAEEYYKTCCIALYIYCTGGAANGTLSVGEAWGWWKRSKRCWRG